ncbi:hypothetical protein [Streptomyces sp. NBC_00470]|uniref:hypothetical protein n=1 Tax=Streptomyces sp. NBC_00470 TaxID=2975753 RepID=UPI002F9137E2
MDDTTKIPESVAPDGGPSQPFAPVAPDGSDDPYSEESGTEQLVAVWFPGELLSNDPDMAGWDLKGQRFWDDVGFGSSWGLYSDLPQTATAAELAGEIAASRSVPVSRVEVTEDPEGFVIASVGAEGQPSHRKGPWTFPLFRVLIRPKAVGSEEAHA